MLHYVETHGFEVLVAYFVAISIVGTMPPLPANAGYWANWAYRFLHAFCGNWRNIMNSIPSMKALMNGADFENPAKKDEGFARLKVMMATLLLGVFLTFAACHGYRVHPGSLNTFDSQTADALLQTKTLLDSSRTKVNGTNQAYWSELAKAYNAANASYRVWRDVAGRNDEKKLQALKQDLTDVTKAVNALRKAGVK